ncbi:MAG TPA: branched-chain amino acid ABC transporter permease [Burkholderiales bacterium]
MKKMSNKAFIPLVYVCALAFGLLSMLAPNDYFFSAAYTVLLFVILSMAWNILGGYTGYVNFGTAAFFAMGAYTTVALFKFDPKMPIGVMIIGGTIIAGLTGLGMGALTLRLRGVFFSIATLALSVVMFTFVVNWDYVGGARGAYVIAPQDVPFGFKRYIYFLYAIMVFLSATSIVVARLIESSTIGRGLEAIRDDELAAECCGVPTLRLKLLSTTISGALMGMAGATYPFFVSYVEPASTFNLSYAVNSIAMPLIGGMTTWIGPLIGSLLLGSVQQWVQVTVSSAWNLLIVGVLLVVFVTMAPEGIMGWWFEFRKRQRIRKGGAQ